MERLLPWFTLKSTPGVGNLLFKRLVDRFGSPERVFSADPAELCRVEGVSSRLAGLIRGRTAPEDVKKEIDRVLQKGYGVTTFADPEYPRLLREIPDPPPYLYVLGSLKDIRNPIAVVGSRSATRYGVSATRRLCGDLASMNFTIVSGMARGIDTAAHAGALAAGGRTVAVLGSGLDHIYPTENADLCRRIAASGAVITEFPAAARPEPHHFPIRNRIISGMSLGAVIVEAAKKSGSLITARLAAEQGREVFAVPGNIHSFKSSGTHRLIKQGAKLVEHAGDVVEELRHMLGPEDDEAPRDNASAPPPSISEEEATVFEALGPYPVHIDELVRKLGMAPGALSAALLQLELKGLVQQLPGKIFVIEGKRR